MTERSGASAASATSGSPQIDSNSSEFFPPVDLSIVVVNYNGGELVETCIGSLYERECRRSFEVIIVDNGSKDGSPERIAKRFPLAKLIRRSSNIGLAKAFNQGVAEMRGRYLLSLDDGTRVLPGSIEALFDFLEANPKIGAAGSRLYDPDMTIQPVARRFPDPLNAIFGRRSILTKLFPNNRFSKRYLMDEFIDSDKPFEVDWTSSAALMVRRSVVDTLGAMDPQYFVYWVDADWCFRMRKSGWGIYCIPQSKVVHLENLRTGHRPRPRSKMVIDFHLGAYRFYRSNYLRAWWTPMGLFSASALLLRATVIVATNETGRLLSHLVSARAKR